MVTVKITFADQTDDSLLGNISLTLSEMDYDKLVSYVTPTMLEKVLKPTEDAKLPELMKTLYQKKDTLKKAVTAFVKAIPNQEKEELMAAVIKEDMIKDRLNEALKSSGLMITCKGVVSESQGE